MQALSCKCSFWMWYLEMRFGCSGAFSSRLTTLAHSLASRGIQQIAQQAFWDVLADGLEAQTPQWERLLALLEEARASLLELIPENADEGKQLRASILEKLDMVSGYSMERLLLLEVCKPVRAGACAAVTGASLLDRLPDTA